MPDAIINPYADDGLWGMTELTDYVVNLPYSYGRINALSLFSVDSITTTTITLEMIDREIRLLPTKPRGDRGTQSKRTKGRALTFTVPHIPAEDQIRPSAYQNLRPSGKKTLTDLYADVMAGILERHRANFDVTWEYMKLGALKGIILDADGQTVLHNLYQEFGVDQKVVDFALDDESTDVPQKCREVSRHVEEYLSGDVFSGIRVLVDSSFFDALISHPTVKERYLNWSAAAQLTDPRKGFAFEGLVFEELICSVPGEDGELVDFIDEGEGHAVPMGTHTTFRQYVAPGDFNETVNTPGELLYARREIEEFGKGVKLWFESNTLALCTRPQALVKVVKSSS